MTETEVFVLADKALTDVVAQIRDDQWDMNMPPDFVMRQTDHTPQTATSFGKAGCQAEEPLNGGKSRSESGGSFVDVVQAVEDRPGDHLPIDLATARHWSLQSERSMGPILVVVAHELGHHRSDMPLTEPPWVL